MMNEKVTQMVDLLFRDVLFSGEVQALYDEVLNKCQDRFADLLHGGMSEEEALSAVMESLTGMEEVLRDYPRRKASAPAAEPASQKTETEAEGPSGSAPVRFSPEEIRAIHGRLYNCDVKVLPSDGDCTLEIIGEVHHQLDPDGKLRIWQEKRSDHLFNGISWEESLNSFEHFGDALNQLARNFSRLVSDGFRSGAPENQVILHLPVSAHPNVNLLPSSGEIDWRGVAPGAEFTLHSTSGDLRVEVERDFLLPDVQIGTTSGDADLRFSAVHARLVTVSGDITWEGRAENAEISSTSGDLEIRGEYQELAMNSTSGDLVLEITSPQAAKLNLNSVSGDIEVRFPAATEEVSASLKTVSGEIRQRGIQLTDTAPVRLQAHTVSGDLKLCRLTVDSPLFRFFS